MRHLLIVSALFCTVPLAAQQLITIQHSCNFDGEEQQADLYTFQSSQEADRIVEQVVSAANLSKNFVVKSADCENALATVDESEHRYILYNTTFLENFKKNGQTKWAAYCVLAHEIGHHANGHSFSTADAKKRKVQELEADKFAGGVLFTMGASLSEAQVGIELLQNSGETATHPPAKARKEAIANGWKNAEEHFKQRSGTNATTTAEPVKEPSTYTPPTVTQGPPQGQSMTAVSDAMIFNALVGQWQCSFTSGGANISNIVTLYANGTGVAQSYTNGYLMNTIYITWQIQQGQYIETFVQTGQWFRYFVNFNGNAFVSFNFQQTNGAANIPYGSILNYNRLQ